MVTELILKPILNHELIGNHLYWKRCGCAGFDKATRTRLTPSCVLEAAFVDRKFNCFDLIRRGVSEVVFALSSYKLRGLFRAARLYRYRWSISMESGLWEGRSFFSIGRYFAFLSHAEYYSP